MRHWIFGGIVALVLSEGLAQAEDDPWIIADELLTRGEKENALAAAKDVPALLKYLQSCTPRPAALELFLAAKKAKGADALALLDKIDTKPVDVVSVRALRERLNVLAPVGRAQEAVEPLKKAVAMARRLGWARMEGIALGGLGYCASERGDVRKAVAFNQRAIAILEKTGPLERLATACGNQGVVLRKLGQWDESIAAFTHARDVREKMGDRFQVGSLTLSIGNAYKDKGDDDSALREYERVLRVGRNLKNRLLIAAALVNSGGVYFRRQQDDKAWEFAEAGLAEAKAAGNTQFAANALVTLAQLHLRAQRPEQARDAASATLRLYPEDASALAVLGKAYRQMRRWREAEEILLRAVAAAKKSNEVQTLLTARLILANTQRELGRFDEALQGFQQQLELARRRHMKTAERDALDGLGTVHADLGNHKKSRGYFEQSIQLSAGNPRSMALSRLSFALSLHRHSRYDEAIEQQGLAVQILTECGDHNRAATHRADLAIMCSNAKRYEDSLAHSAKAIAAARKLNDRPQEIICLVGLAGTYDAMGQQEKAIEYVRQALDVELEPQRAGRVVRFLVLSGKTCRLDDPASALLLLGRALELARVLKDVPLQVEALALTGRVQDALGHLDDALESANAAVRTAETAKSEGALAIGLLHLGWIRLSRSEFDEAEAALQRSIALFAKRRDSVGEANAWSYLGSVAEKRGHLNVAMQHLERALKLQAAVGGPNAAGGHKVIGNLAASLGRHEEAIEHYARALKVREEAGTLALMADSLAYLRRFDEASAFAKRAAARLSGHESPLALVRVRERLARVHAARGEFRKAEAVWRKQLENSRKSGDQYGEALALRRIALFLRKRGEFPRALEILEGLQDRGGLHHARNLIALGLTYGASGDYDRALPLFNRALVEGERTGSAADISQSLNGISNCAFRAGDLDAAAAALKRILEVTEDAEERYFAIANLGSIAKVRGRHRESLEYFKRADTLRPAASIKKEIGEALVHMGQRKEAHDYLQLAVELDRDASTLTALAAFYLVDAPEKAVPLLEEAIARVEQTRNRARGLSIRQQALYFRELRAGGDPYQGMMDAQRMLGQPAQALEYAERGRGRAALDLLERSRIDPLVEAERRAHTRGDKTTLARIAKLRTDLDRADIEIARLTPFDDADALATARQKLNGLLEKRARIVRRLLPVGAPISAAAIQGLLGKDEWLLYYVVADTAVQIFVVPPAGGEVQMHVSWLKRTNLAKLVGRERVQATRTRSLDAPETTKPDARLFEQIVPPAIWKEIRKAKRVYVLPDGPLHRLPFEMLVVDDSGTSWLEAGPAISYALSGSMLSWCKQRRDAHEDIDLPHDFVALGDARMPKGLAPLPGTRREATAVGGLLLLGDDATKEKLFDAAGKTAVLHIATHQIADERDTYGFSRLALTGGYLHLYELFDKWRDHLSACQLVVLSACQTVKGPTQRDEAPYAMPLGFLYAGAPAVIGSLWSVDDESTAELFADFYKRLAKGAPKLEAFTEARKALKKKYPSPYHWAAFVYIGDPR